MVSLPSRYTCAMSLVRAPIETPAPITQYGPISASGSISAAGSTIAVGWIAILLGLGLCQLRGRLFDWLAVRRLVGEHAHQNGLGNHLAIDFRGAFHLCGRTFLRGNHHLDDDLIARHDRAAELGFFD